ncbi:MAG: ABC transporter ATP-binding protein [Clostridia bacterium]|nr:ABC transporter ATP-binding protein [Clostridia bacterium]
MREIIRFDHVRMAFGEKEIFSDLSLSFSTSGQYAILGPSGRGKTTLLRLIAGLEKPRSGTITISQNTRICFCFQEDRLLPWKTVLENVALVCDPETAGYWLDQVGLSGEENNYPASLSGGMKRRASLARALAYDADILLMDEPFRALDDATHTKMLALVREAAKDKLLILVTHDEADADGMEIVRI